MLFTPPPDYHRIQIVRSFEELITTPFADGVNALCWPRTLPGDFAEVVEKLALAPGITTISDERLQSLSLSEAGSLARQILVHDQNLLRAAELSPVLDGVFGYTDEEEEGPFPTQVQSWHVDSATVPADTWLCTYHGLSSEGLRNDRAQRRIDIPETRAELLRYYGGEDDEQFLEFLNDHYYDLHYLPLDLPPKGQESPTFTFGLHNLWRIATAYPGSPVPPCIHRAPESRLGDLPRLLLIS